MRASLNAWHATDMNGNTCTDTRNTQQPALIQTERILVTSSECCHSSVGNEVRLSCTQTSLQSGNISLAFRTEATEHV